MLSKEPDDRETELPSERNLQLSLFSGIPKRQKTRCALRVPSTLFGAMLETSISSSTDGSLKTQSGVTLDHGH